MESKCLTYLGIIPTHLLLNKKFCLMKQIHFGLTFSKIENIKTTMMSKNNTAFTYT